MGVGVREGGGGGSGGGEDNLVDREGVGVRTVGEREREGRRLTCDLGLHGGAVFSCVSGAAGIRFAPALVWIELQWRGWPGRGGLLYAASRSRFGHAPFGGRQIGTHDHDAAYEYIVQTAAHNRGHFCAH